MKNPIQMIKQCQANEEPFFILRGQDACALAAIQRYYEDAKIKVRNAFFIEEIEQILGDFEAFAKQEGTDIPD